MAHFRTLMVGGVPVQANDAQLDSLAGLSYAGNGTKVVRVNAGETGFELATVSGSGDGLGPDGDKGDITVGGSGTTLTIDNDAVTYAKIQNVSATDRVLGRSSAGAGDVEEIACTAAGRALIDDADATAQRSTLGLGALATLATVGTSQVDNDAITYAKIQNVTDARLLGRSAGSAGDAQEITVGSGLSLSGGALTATGGSSPTGVLSDMQFSVLQADGNLAEASGVQTWAGSDRTSQDVFTVAANTTYRVRGNWIVNTGTTSHTTAMAWALATATVTSFEYLVTLWSAAANTITTTQSTTHVTGVASKVLNAASTAVYTIIQFEGILVVGTGGTITPQINFSANPTGTCLMKRGSWTSFESLGADTVTLAGGWA